MPPKTATNADSPIQHVEVLETMSEGKDRALEFLERLVKVTSPVLRRRGWRVGQLKEFYPTSPGLMGLNKNHGECIMIRLRRPGDESQFFEWHTIMGTMVHEITHNHIGNHSAEFYELMDVLYGEVEKVEDGTDKNVGSGAADGEPVFEGKSRRLGGKFGRNVPIERRSDAAATAALQRFKFAPLCSTQRLGGSGVGGVPLSKDELRRRAAVAAERRLRDREACREVLSDGIDVVLEDAVGAAATKGLSALAGSSSLGIISGSSSCSTSGTIAASKVGVGVVFTTAKNEWVCKVCTTSNTVDASAAVSATEVLPSRACSYCTCLRVSALPPSDNKKPIFVDLCSPPDLNGLVALPLLQPSVIGPLEVVELLSDDCDDGYDDDDDDCGRRNNRRSEASRGDPRGTKRLCLLPTHLQVHAWTCPICTLFNNATLQHCVACGHKKGLLAGLAL